MLSLLATKLVVRGRYRRSCGWLYSLDIEFGTFIIVDCGEWPYDGDA